METKEDAIDARLRCIEAAVKSGTNVSVNESLFRARRLWNFVLTGDIPESDINVSTLSKAELASYCELLVEEITRIHILYADRVSTNIPKPPEHVPSYRPFKGKADF